MLPNKVVWFVGVDVEFVLSCGFDPFGRYGDESEQETLDSVCGLDEIKQKLSGLNVTVPDTKAGEDYTNFFIKHLKNGNFKIEIPLTQYYPELASEKGADKMTAFIVVGFYAGYDGAFSLRVDMPTKTTAKMEKLAAQYTVEHTKYKYEYKDGVLTMNNEEYKIDPATGNLINIKRNVTFNRF